MSGSTYLPTPTSQTTTVTGGSTATATVTYAAGAGASLNLTISGMYLTQGVAAFDGTTKLVAGRNAYLRVFVVANEANSATPAVRVGSTTGDPGADLPQPPPAPRCRPR
ncbi:MAG: hypothetical protein R2882_13885 [Gemmatimonadales bacterium]